MVKAALCWLVSGSVMYLLAASNIGSIGIIEYGIKKPGNIVIVYCIFSPVCILWL